MSSRSSALSGANPVNPTLRAWLTFRNTYELMFSNWGVQISSKLVFSVVMLDQSDAFQAREVSDQSFFFIQNYDFFYNNRFPIAFDRKWLTM